MKYLQNFNEVYNTQIDYNLLDITNKVVHIEDIFGDVLYTNTPSRKDLNEMNRWLKNNPNTLIRLYHGTSTNHNILEQGIKKTSAKNVNSLSSSFGYVYLSPFESTAKMFGELGNPYGNIVYTVDVPIRLLKPDKDQLFNKRNVEDSNDIRITLADSIVYGRSVCVKGNIPPYMINRDDE